MIITKFAFRNLFTFEERVAMEEASTQSSVVRTLINDMMTASEIDLEHSGTIQGVNYLEQLGLLVAGRAAEILATTPEEVPADSILSDEPIKHYTVTVKALSDITLDNVYGAEKMPTGEYKVKAEFRNNTDGVVRTETFVFGYEPPNQEFVDSVISEYLKELKVG